MQTKNTEQKNTGRLHTPEDFQIIMFIEIVL
jgi:hypothetical protein